MASSSNLKLPLERKDIILEGCSALALLCLWAAAYYFYRNAPETVPTHFTLSGKADGFGDRGSVFITAAICTLLYLTLTMVSRTPRLFNYPVKITPENAQKQYTLVVHFLRVVKIAVVFLFLLIEWHTYRSAIGMQPGNWTFVIALALIKIPLLWYLIKSSQAQPTAKA